MYKTALLNGTDEWAEWCECEWCEWTTVGQSEVHYISLLNEASQEKSIMLQACKTCADERIHLSALRRVVVPATGVHETPRGCRGYARDKLRERHGATRHAHNDGIPSARRERRGRGAHGIRKERRLEGALAA